MFVLKLVQNLLYYSKKKGEWFWCNFAEALFVSRKIIQEVGIELSPDIEIDKTLTFEAFVCKYRYENRQEKKTGYTSSKMLGLGKVSGTTKKRMK